VRGLFKGFYVVGDLLKFKFKLLDNFRKKIEFIGTSKSLLNLTFGLIKLLKGFTNLKSTIFSSSNHIAIKGKQKKECIEIPRDLLKLNKRGLLFRRNINPPNLEKKELNSLTSMQKFFFL